MNPSRRTVASSSFHSANSASILPNIPIAEKYPSTQPSSVTGAPSRLNPYVPLNSPVAQSGGFFVSMGF